jgi:hypothetical protein
MELDAPGDEFPKRFRRLTVRRHAAAHVLPLIFQERTWLSAQCCRAASSQ